MRQTSNTLTWKRGNQIGPTTLGQQSSSSNFTRNLDIYEVFFVRQMIPIQRDVLFLFCRDSNNPESTLHLRWSDDTDKWTDRREQREFDRKALRFHLPNDVHIQVSPTLLSTFREWMRDAGGRYSVSPENSWQIKMTQMGQ